MPETETPGDERAVVVNELLVLSTNSPAMLPNCVAVVTKFNVKLFTLVNRRKEPDATLRLFVETGPLTESVTVPADWKLMSVLPEMRICLTVCDGILVAVEVPPLLNNRLSVV